MRLDNTYQEPIYLNECNINRVNIYPIEPNAILKYLYIKNILSKQEIKLYYLKYVLNNKYTIKEYCTYLNCSKEEYETLLNKLNEKIINKFEDIEKYKNYKNKILKKYKTEIFNLFIKEMKEIEFSDLIEKFSQYSLEELSEIYPIISLNKELLRDFFQKSKKTNLNVQENEIVYKLLRKVEKNIKEYEGNIILSKKQN